MSCEPVIRLTQVSKQFTLYRKPADRLWQSLGLLSHPPKVFHALSDISFAIEKGDVLGVVGRNGAGKSTLLQLISGTLQASSGRIAVQGKVAALLELGAGFNGEFSGRENIYMNAALLGLSRTEIDTKMHDIISFAELEAFIDQPVKTYSSGMFVRLAFSIATSVTPDILIIDEALSVGDGAFARKSFDRIMSLKNQGTTILFCSHSLFHIEAICNKAIWLNAGQLMMLDSPYEVIRAYQQTLTPAVPQQDITPKSHQTAYLTAVECSVNGVCTRFPSIISGEEDVQIDIRFYCDPQLPTPVIAWGIDSLEDVAISSASSLYEGISFVQQSDGVYAVRLTFPQLPLLRGQYWLNIMLTCEQMIHVYDNASHYIQLNVRQDGLARGVVRLPHTWSMIAS